MAKREEAIKALRLLRIAGNLVDYHLCGDNDTKEIEILYEVVNELCRLALAHLANPSEPYNR